MFVIVSPGEPHHLKILKKIQKKSEKLMKFEVLKFCVIFLAPFSRSQRQSALNVSASPPPPGSAVQGTNWRNIMKIYLIHL